jgi:hypothetical protein
VPGQPTALDEAFGAGGQSSWNDSHDANAMSEEQALKAYHAVQFCIFRI